MTLTLREKLKRLRALERGDSPDDWWAASAEMPEPAPPEKPKRIPRVAITQPTNAGESRTLKVKQEREKRPCEQCGAPYQPKSKLAKYCSKACGIRAASDRVSAAKRVMIACRHCGVEYQRSPEHMTYCSDECAKTAAHKLQLAAQKRSRGLTMQEKGLTYQCKECAKVTVYVTGRELFCSPSCRERFKGRAYRQRKRGVYVS